MAVEFDVDDDLRPFAPDIDEAKAEAMIADAVAIAASIAPCILDDSFVHAAAAKAILRGAILRWNEQGSGALSANSETVGPFGRTLSMDTRTPRRAMFQPSEITTLQRLCRTAGRGGAYTIKLGGEDDDSGGPGPMW